MKIAVLLHWNEGETSGVFKKTVSQVRLWESLGASVSLHVISRKTLLDEWRQNLQNTTVTLYPYHSGIERLRAWQTAAKAIQSQSPDIVYHRYDLWMPPLRILGHNMPLILEINTNDLTEYLRTSFLRGLYNCFTRTFLLRKAAGLVFVTHELSKLPYFARYRKPSCVISNGIALDDYRTLPAPNNPEPRLFFIGTDGQPWHGVDKIIRMAQLFPKWHFDIVGIEPERFKYSPPNVYIYGPLNRQTYELLLAKADVAVGTLALHRKRMNEACPLKTREYLAYGLPVIVGYKDTDFMEGVPFILELPNREDNIEQSTTLIKEWVLTWKGKRVPREAVVNIDIKAKEASRLAFFENLLREKHGTIIPHYH